ncbi:MAG: two-component system response regulator DevR [Cellvibrionaceae bacterium]|jgi:two-component system response regulator DevR
MTALEEKARKRVRVILVDDHEVVRLGLKSLIERFSQIDIVAEAGSEAEAVEQAFKHQPDVILMDIRLGAGSGIEATRQIKLKLKATKIIMLTSFADQELLLEAIRAGASGYVLKQVGSGELIRTIEAVSRGETILDPSLTPSLFDAMRSSMKKEESAAFVALTKQEIQVLALIMEGQTNNQIGDEMFLSYGTIRNYVSNILGKLQVRNRSEATAYAIRHHLTEYIERQEKE